MCKTATLFAMISFCCFVQGQVAEPTASRLESLQKRVRTTLRDLRDKFAPVNLAAKDSQVAQIIEASKVISEAIAAEQLAILQSGQDVNAKLNQLSSAFRIPYTEDERNPLIDGAFTEVGRRSLYVAAVSTVFENTVGTRLTVALNIFRTEGSISNLESTLLEEMVNTSSYLQIIPTKSNYRSFVLVSGHDLLKMQYHERAAMYQIDQNGIRLLWRSGYLQNPQLNVGPEQVVIKQALNLVGGDFSELAAEYPEFKGYAIRTLTIVGESVSESAPSLVPME